MRWRRRAKQAQPPAAAPRKDLVGTRAQIVAGVDASGGLVALEPAAGAVIFLTSSCLACRDIWAALADGRAAHVQVAAVVTPDPSLEDRRAVAAGGVPAVMSSAAWFAYGAGPSPWVAVVLGGLVVAEGTVAGWDELVALVGGPAPA